MIAYVVTLTCRADASWLITALLVFELFRNSALPREKFGWAFLFTGTTWDPVAGQFGALTVYLWHGSDVRPGAC